MFAPRWCFSRVTAEAPMNFHRTGCGSERTWVSAQCASTRGHCRPGPHSDTTSVFAKPVCPVCGELLCVTACTSDCLPQPMLTKGQRGNAVGQAVRSRCPLPRGGHPRCLPRCPGSADSTTSTPPRSSPPHTTSWPGEASGSKSPLPREIEMGHTGHTATLGSAL